MAKCNWAQPCASSHARRNLRSGAIPIATHKETTMKSALKITAALACGLSVGGGAVQLLHAQSKPPAVVVAEVAVRDQEGFNENFLKATQKDIANHGGKYLAAGYNKTESLVGNPPPNRVAIL